MRNLFYLFIFGFIFFGLSNLSDFIISDSFNRRVYAFNRGFDKSFLNPSVAIYVKVCPSILDKGLDNFFKNISELQSIILFSLLSDEQSLKKSFYRFVLNSTFGLFGIIDIASCNKNFYNHVDVQTFLIRNGSYKFVYMMLPVIGPGTLYFNLSLVVSHLCSPFFYFFDYIFFYYFLEILNKKSGIFFDGSFFHDKMLDGYTFLKDIYIQNNEGLFENNIDSFLGEPPD